MTRYKSIPVLALVAAAALPIAAASGRVPITTAQIAAAITGSGMNVSPQQVTLLTEVVAATANPALSVESVEHWGNDRMKVRLECASHEECLPFLVAVQLNGNNAAQPILVGSSTRTAQTRPSSNSFVVHSGSPAILLLDGDHVHIELTVVCLENGAKGQRIRVASNDHQQTFSAEVVDASLLKGKL